MSRTDVKHVAIFGPDAAQLRNIRIPVLRMLRRRGYRVTAICPDDGRIGAILQGHDVEYWPLAVNRSSLNPLADLPMALRLLGFLRREKVNALLAYTIKPIVYGMPAARLAGVKRRVGMVTGVGYGLTPGKGLKRRLARRAVITAYGLAGSAADRLIFQNLDDLGLFRDEGLLKDEAKAALVAGSGVELDRFTPQPLPEGPVTFVMVARLLRDKGVYEYVAAAKAVKARNPQTRFLLVGGMDENPAAVPRAHVDEWVVSGAIEYVGLVDDVRPYLARSHVFVLPSYREGTPRSALEAMAVGRAILTTDAPGCREVVRAGVSGMLVPVQDAEALARAMLAFVENPDLARTMGEASRRFCEERFDAEAVTADILGILLGEEGR